MRNGTMRDSRGLLRRKQFEASEMARNIALTATMIKDFDNMIAELNRQIAAEEDRARIKDTEHPAYSSLAKAMAKRRENLLISAAKMKLKLDVVKRELQEVIRYLLSLEPIQYNLPPAAATNSTAEAVSAPG